MLVLNPPDDDAFRGTALDLLGDGVEEPSALETALRRTYPNAVVRPRELAGERTEIWYVYRDGRWVRPGQSRATREDATDERATF
jgi:hypothetical protein